MSTPKNRNAGSLTPTSDNEIYKIASKSLKSLTPPFHISPIELGKYFELLSLPCRRLVRSNLITPEQMRQHVNQPSTGQEMDWTPVNTSEPEIDSGSSTDDKDSKKERKDDPKKETDTTKCHTVSSSGPIASLLQSKGINISSEKLGRLMVILSTPPKLFVQKGLLSAESVVVPREDELLNEIHFFRRFSQKEKQDKSRNPSGTDHAHNATHVTNIHHHYYYMDSYSYSSDEVGGEGMNYAPYRSNNFRHRTYTAPHLHPPMHSHPAPFDHETGHLTPPHFHRGGRFGPHRRGPPGKQGYSTDH